MQWDWKSRRLTLSVGELSRFSLFAATDEGTGRWRMELGSHWHDVLQKRAIKEDPHWLTEQAVAGSLSQNGWQFDLRGRIDLFRPGTPAVLKEIKTTSQNLPLEEEELREIYPHYFHQAMLYAFLLGKDGQFPQTELVFLEIQTGMTQTVVLGELDLQALYEHLNEVVLALEERHSHFGRIRSYKVPQPFDAWRPGQLETRNLLQSEMHRSRYCLLEAPTGFGKTGIALEQGLTRLAAGDVDRILLLTSKNTGHAALIKQLEAFRNNGHELAIHAVRSRRDLALDHETERLIAAQEIAQSWKASGLSASHLLKEGIVDVEYTKALGLRHGIPPWAISRILLPFADVWIADFNYLFDPAVAQVLDYIPTHDPSRTVLIIDEAHNLPERVAASHSHVLDIAAIDKVLSEVQFAHYSTRLVRLLDRLLSLIKKQRPTDSLDPPVEAELFDLLKDVQECIRESGLVADELSLECLEWLWNISYLLDDWNHPHLPILVSCPQAGQVKISCLDASSVIAPVLDNYFQVVLMSATLQPWQDFLGSIGLTDGAIPPNDHFRQSKAARILGTAPWLDGCFEVMIDARVDTRYRRRESFVWQTADTIALSAESCKGCTVVFFPSYRYAETVLERLQFKHPLLRVALQPRDLPLEEQTGFLESALIFQDVLLLVLGSRFSEGIDSLGGKVRQAIVVSPALPEVNSIQREREKTVAGGSAAAFRKIYLIPGLRKISQALGRLVRSPEHSARILLHGRRFMEPEYQDLLPHYLQPVDHILTDQDFAKKWLKS